MRFFFLVFFTLFSATLMAQIHANLFSEKADKGVVIYGINEESCPVTVNINWQLQNMAPSTPDTLFVIPAKMLKHPLLHLKFMEGRKGHSFSFRYHKNLGDATLVSYDKDFVYELPFSAGGSFRLVQGYNGLFSHAGENALDFTMPEGTPVVAARGGMVIKVEQNNNSGCPREECKSQNNTIVIYHDDGTMAEYAHLRYRGAKVNIGDRVRKGDVIGSSGNTGWSSGPHLHFVVYRTTPEGRRSLPTLFQTEAGAAYLEENNSYRKP